MLAVRLIALAALLLASPAYAEGWRVLSVAGDAVSVNGADPDPLDVGTVVNEGATVVSGPQSTVLLSRRGDIVSMNADTMIVLHPGAGGARATVETKSGAVEITSVANAEGPLDVRTHFFHVSAQAADFTVKTRKDFATVDVGTGQVQVADSLHGGAPVALGAGDSFRGTPKASAEKPAEDGKTPDGKTKANGTSADADAAVDQLDQTGKKKAKGKRQSDLAAKIAKHAGAETKDGLDALADEYNGEAVDPETPKIGLLKFLFGPNAPSAGIVLLAICVLFLGSGYLTSNLLRGAGFGMFGNGAILLVGALLGAGLHDLTFSPAFFWAYEPTPGILTTVAGALAALIGACFTRKRIQDGSEPAEAAPSAKSAAIQARLGRRGATS